MVCSKSFNIFHVTELSYYKHFTEKLQVNETVFVHGIKVCMHRNNISSFVEFGKECPSIKGVMN